MPVYRKYQTLLLLISTLFATLILLVGCNQQDTGSTATTSAPSMQGRTLYPTVVINPKTGTNKPGTGPIIIQTPTPVPGGSSSSQQITLPDRTLVIESVSRQANTATNMTTVTVKLMVKDTSSQSIKNLATSYQLVGAEGDMFGLPAGTTGTLFGTIAPGSSRSGTLAFQEIPSFAVQKLQLLYRSESAQTVFITLNA